MAEITVRNPSFDYAAPIDLVRSDEELATLLPILAISLTMPSLEPYLIRTMKAALERLGDDPLAEDVRRFSRQEAHHYRNHALLNERLHEQFPAGTAGALRALESRLERDYQRFTREKSLRFNLAYAEGFEAMTCAGALATAEFGLFDVLDVPGSAMWKWHIAEEIEHRSVAFDVYRRLVGSYAHRIVSGTRAQWHYLSYVARLTGCMAAGLGRRLAQPRTPMHRRALRNYLRTFSPFYDPAAIALPAGLPALLDRYAEPAPLP